MACSAGKQNKVAKQSAQTNRLYGEVNRMKSMYGLLNVKSNTNRQLIQANKSKNRGAVKNIDKERKEKEKELNKLDTTKSTKAPKSNDAKSAQKFGALLENSPDST